MTMPHVLGALAGSRPSSTRPTFIVREIGLAAATFLLLAIALMGRLPTLHSMAAPAASADQDDSAPRELSMPAALRQALRDGQPLAGRLVTMTRLEQMSDSALPLLLIALSDSDQAVRLAAVQVLGWIGAPAATDGLLEVTLDPAPAVRESAIWALGEVGALRALPRLQQLQIVQSNFYVQEAAYLAEQRLNALIADQLGLGSSQVHVLAVASENDQAFAVTSRGLYTTRGGQWRRLNNLPAHPADVVAASADGKLVYVGTRGALYRSQDGGETWLEVEDILPGQPPVRVTAIAIDPADSRRVYAALVSAAPTGLQKTPLGIYVSADSGKTWSALSGSPRDHLTTRLGLDRSMPTYLFGSTGVGTWRYTLVNDVPDSRSE